MTAETTDSDGEDNTCVSPGGTFTRWKCASKLGFTHNLEKV